MTRSTRRLSDMFGETTEAFWQGACLLEAWAMLQDGTHDLWIGIVDEQGDRSWHSLGAAAEAYEWAAFKQLHEPHVDAWVVHVHGGDLDDLTVQHVREAVESE